MPALSPGCPSHRGACSNFYPDNPELENLLLVAVTELNQIHEMEAFVQLLQEWL